MGTWCHSTGTTMVTGNVSADTFSHFFLVTGDGQPVLVTYTILLIHCCHLQGTCSWDTASSAHLDLAAGFSTLLVLGSVYILPA